MVIENEWQSRQTCNCTMRSSVRSTSGCPGTVRIGQGTSSRHIRLDLQRNTGRGANHIKGRPSLCADGTEKNGGRIQAEKPTVAAPASSGPRAKSVAPPQRPSVSWVAAGSNGQSGKSGLLAEYVDFRKEDGHIGAPVLAEILGFGPDQGP